MKGPSNRLSRDESIGNRRPAALLLLLFCSGLAWTQTEDCSTASSSENSESSALKLVLAIEAAMVRVEAGVFTMGSDQGLPDTRPAHSVALSRSFLISRHEATFEEYDAYCALSGARNPKDNGWGRGRRPVIDVSYTDAVRFCNFLSRSAGLTPCYDEDGRVWDFSANGYRLPTEAEWEYAARGGVHGSGFSHAGSNDPEEVAVFGSALAPEPVESKKPNELGLYDMSGNVWEWCQDWYAAAYYAKAPIGTAAWPDPSGPGAAEADRSYGVKRVRRGGNYHESAESATVFFRSRDLPRQADPGMGFRIVRNAE